MPGTLYEKILARKLGRPVDVGEIVEVDVDRAMIHDFFTPFVIRKFREMGFTRPRNPESVVIIYDHLVPTSFPEDSKYHRVTEEFIQEHGLRNVHRTDGISHQIMCEQGYIRPGDISVGTDSHTVMYGGLGAIATGVGYTEMAAVLGTGRTWLKVVPSIRVSVDGRLGPGVFSKDIILRVIADIGGDGATYKALEFGGGTIDAMSVDSRLTLSNMSVEAGAKTGLIAADDAVLSYVARHGDSRGLHTLAPDPDAEYERVLHYDAAELEPVIACPHTVENVKPIGDCEGIEVQQAFLGSCTNGRLEDFEIAARVLSGRKVHPQLRFYVVPASREIFQAAVAAGYVETLIEAGAVVNQPGCSLCCGRSGGLLDAGERVISSNNRNYIGRMGSAKAEIYLGSPATVAASAVEGRITDPRVYLR
ncbi:3-isopropylmalate dehydratase large subunit [Streptomyces olivoreticuli]